MAQPSPLPPPRVEQQRVAEAVAYFRATVSSQAVSAARHQAAQYAGDRVWSELSRDRTGRSCKGLARLARLLLDGKDWLHSMIGKIIVWIMELCGMPPIARVFGEEVARRIPLPWDQQVVVVARGMQVAGILVCLLNGRDLMQCQCFRDVVIDEGKERLQQLIERATQDWRGLGDLVPS